MQYRHPRHHHPRRDVTGKICYGSVALAVTCGAISLFAV